MYEYKEHIRLIITIKYITSIYLSTVGKKNIWSPADFVRLPTDKEIISL